METLPTHEKQHLSGATILRLTTITDRAYGPSLDTTMTKTALMHNLVFGDGLKEVDQLLIDGSDARLLLPRPDAYGNNRLALMALLDTLPANTIMAIELETAASLAVAAD